MDWKKELQNGFQEEFGIMEIKALTDDGDKEECGYYGISKEECESRECNW